MTTALACGACRVAEDGRVAWQPACREHHIASGVLLEDGTWCPRRPLPGGQTIMLAWGRPFAFPVVGMN